MYTFRNAMIYRPHIPYACGTHSVALRNPFRTHTEYEVDARRTLQRFYGIPESVYKDNMNDLPSWEVRRILAPSRGS